MRADVEYVEEMAVVLDRAVEAPILRVAAAGRSAGQPEQREGIRGLLRIVFGDEVRERRVLTAERERSPGGRAHADEGLLERLSGDARIDVRALRVERAAVVLRDRFQGVGDLARRRIEIGLELEHARPIHEVQRLFALDADSRLAHAVRGEAGHGIVAVLLDDVRAARDEVVAEGRAMGFILEIHVDDAVEGDAVPGQAFVRRCRSSGRRRGLRLRGASHRQRTGQEASSQVRKAAAA